MSAFQRDRELLGQRLRELRRNARLSGRQLAATHGWSPSKVSKIEAGRQTPSDDDVEAWASACGVPDAAPDLMAALRSLDGHYLEKRRTLRAGLARNQRSITELVERSAFVRLFEVAVVPGLLQTAEYARYRLAGSTVFGATDVDDAVAERMARQQHLYRVGRRFHLVVSEAALRLRLCPSEVMLGQLDRLVSATTLNNVRCGVIPLGAQHSRAPLHGFWIYDEDLVTIETFSASLRLSEPSEVQSYLAVFAHFAELAVYGAQARALISRIARELTD